MHTVRNPHSLKRKNAVNENEVTLINICHSCRVRYGLVLNPLFEYNHLPHRQLHIFLPRYDPLKNQVDVLVLETLWRLDKVAMELSIQTARHSQMC